MDGLELKAAQLRQNIKKYHRQDQFYEARNDEYQLEIVNQKLKERNETFITNTGRSTRK